MGFSKNTAINIDLGRSNIDIHDIGFVKPRLSLEIEASLRSTTMRILDKRKSEFYWYILSAFPLAYTQLIDYARKHRGLPSLTALQDVMYATELSQQQIIHLVNGGEIDSIKQENFKFIKEGIFTRTQLYNPRDFLVKEGLLSIASNSFDGNNAANIETPKKNLKQKMKITNRGIWVFYYMQTILYEMQKHSEMPSNPTFNFTDISEYKSSHESSNGVREGPLQ